MLGHGSKFDQKMEQAITALLSHRSIEEAAREVGVSANTLLRWMKDPEFQSEIREARRTVFSHAIGRLQDAAGAAATTLLKIMLDPAAPAATRLRAAEVVLEQAANAGEIEAVADRVAQLEQTTGLEKQPPKSAPKPSRLSATSSADTPAQIGAPSPAAGEDNHVV